MKNLINKVGGYSIRRDNQIEMRDGLFLLSIERIFFGFNEMSENMFFTQSPSTNEKLYPDHVSIKSWVKRRVVKYCIRFSVCGPGGVQNLINLGFDVYIYESNLKKGYVSKRTIDELVKCEE